MDISGYGLQARLVASQTFPAGITISQFADDGDPFDMPDHKIADAAMGLNGDLVTWNNANPIMFNLAVVPGGDDDENLAVLLEANRAGKGKQPIRDNISITGIYPDGSTISLLNGIIVEGMPGNSVAANGRLKTKSYKFVFENKVGTN